jgi:hypothetical protein
MTSPKTLTSIPTDMNDQLAKSLVEAEETIERLKRELEYSRQETRRVQQEAQEKEQSHFRLEMESQAKKNDLNHLRIQAEEVAKRRKLEKEVIRLKEELQQAKQEKDRFRLDLAEAKQLLSEQREKTLLEAQEEIANIRAQAKEAWRHAEDETSRLDGEVAKLKQRLQNEKSHRTQAEQTISKLEATIARMRQNESESQMDHLDKIHFDKLLKKAHLAIKTLQEKLGRSMTERDQYLKELSQIRAQLIEHKLEDIMKEPAGSSEPKPESTPQKTAEKPAKKHEKVSYLAETLIKRRPEGLRSLPKEGVQQISLDEPLFGDEFSDELLLIEPDMSFDNNEEEQSLILDMDRNSGPSETHPEKSEPQTNRAAVNLKEPPRTPRASSSSDTNAYQTTDSFYDDDTSDKAIAELAKELLQGTNSPNKPTARGKSAPGTETLDKRSKKQWKERIERPRFRFKGTFIFIAILALLTLAGIGAWQWLSKQDISLVNQRLLRSPTYQRLLQERASDDAPTASDPNKTDSNEAPPSLAIQPVTPPAPSSASPATSGASEKPAPISQPSPSKEVEPKLAQPTGETRTPISDAPSSTATEFEARPIPATTHTEGSAPALPSRPADAPTPTPPKTSTPAQASDQPASQTSDQSASETSAPKATPLPTAPQPAEPIRSPESEAEENRLRNEAENELKEAVKKLDPVRRLLN